MDEYIKRKEQQQKLKSWYLYEQNYLDGAKAGLGVCQNSYPTQIPLGSANLGFDDGERHGAKKEGIQP